MDFTNWSAGVLTSASFATVCAALYAVYRCINHREIRSKCCGREAQLSLDINETPHPTAEQTRTSTAERAALAPDIVVRVPTTI